MALLTITAKCVQNSASMKNAQVSFLVDPQEVKDPQKGTVFNSPKGITFMTDNIKESVNFVPGHLYEFTISEV